MATYLIKKEIQITRQEGDTADVVVTVPDVIDMSKYTTVKFLVKDVARENEIMSKTTGLGIIVTGQTINIALSVNDTKGKNGKFRWELEISNDTPEVITIGRGVFVVTQELIK